MFLLPGDVVRILNYVRAVRDDTTAPTPTPTPSPTPIPPVGGLAGYPDEAAPAGDSGPSAGTYALVAGLVTAAVGTLVAGAWYARRRRLS